MLSRYIFFFSRWWERRTHVSGFQNIHDIHNKFPFRPRYRLHLPHPPKSLNFTHHVFLIWNVPCDMRTSPSSVCLAFEVFIQFRDEIHMGVNRSTVMAHGRTFVKRKRHHGPSQHQWSTPHPTCTSVLTHPQSTLCYFSIYFLHFSLVPWNSPASPSSTVLPLSR